MSKIKMCKLMSVFIVQFTITYIACINANPFHGGNIIAFDIFPNLLSPSTESHGAKNNVEHTDKVVENTPGKGNKSAVSTNTRYNLSNT